MKLYHFKINNYIRAVDLSIIASVYFNSSRSLLLISSLCIRNSISILSILLKLIHILSVSLSGLGIILRRCFDVEVLRFLGWFV